MSNSFPDDASRRAFALAQFEGLSPSAKEVLGQLFLNGPKWDGAVASKTGRDELRNAGFIERGFGWQWLTADGMVVAVFAPWKDWHDGLCRRKANTSIG